MTGIEPPGWPGILPRWTSSAKHGVGTALDDRSPVWFTLSHGIVNEIYYPTIDQANTRDLGFLVADGSDFFSEEKRDTRFEIETLAPGTPAYKLTNRCLQERYEISKVILTDPSRPVLLQQVSFRPLKESMADYGLYALLAPHIGNQGYGNDGWMGDYKGIPMLFAARGQTALALACSAGFSGRSCGYVGTSDGWQDVSAHKRMAWSYPAAFRRQHRPDRRDPSGGLRRPVSSGARLREELGRGGAERPGRAAGGLRRDPGCLSRGVGSGAEEEPGDAEGSRSRQIKQRLSAAVLRTHEAKSFRGGMIASLSIPWGSAKGDDDLGGYHLVWPRDLVESAGGAAGRRRPRAPAACSLSDGHPGGGRPLAAEHVARRHALLERHPDGRDRLSDPARRLRSGAKMRLERPRSWPMVRAGGRLHRSQRAGDAAGPLGGRRRLLARSRWPSRSRRCWPPPTSRMTPARTATAALPARDRPTPGTRRSRRGPTSRAPTSRAQIGVDGYYVRIAPPDAPTAPSPKSGFVPIKNRPPG